MYPQRSKFKRIPTQKQRELVRGLQRISYKRGLVVNFELVTSSRIRPVMQNAHEFCARTINSTCRNVQNTCASFVHWSAELPRKAVGTSCMGTYYVPGTYDVTCSVVYIVYTTQVLNVYYVYHTTCYIICPRYIICPHT